MVYYVGVNKKVNKTFNQRKVEKPIKKTLKKSLATTLALIFVLTLSLVAFAADITKDKAKEIALNDAGYSLSDVMYITAEYELDDGFKKWNVDFVVQDSDGHYRDYDYEINAADGKILEKEWDYEDDYYGGTAVSLEDRFEQFFAKIIAWILSLFS